MILARIYPFARKDIKMKLDRVKEEVANIRRTQNFFLTALVGIVAYLFANFELKPNLRNVLAVSALIVLVPILLSFKDAMKRKLSELEKTGKDE
ncbi:hypothetical protein CHELV3228_a0082 (plasmid) [Campylobacter helveticus]|nr:hypothetical protein CHELV3228_a0082 [Campylobacter helveticus]SMC25331.1 hypothetical protein SAMN02745125_01996 [Campylobacter helveticus]SUW87688.1 Uncharacterised protein [Campylobacter helveticus]